METVSFGINELTGVAGIRLNDSCSAGQTVSWRSSCDGPLTPVLASHPGLLGIGIDEDAAAVIQGHRLEVFGDGHVGIYDGKVHGDKSYYDLSSGDRFDLHMRAPAPAG